MAQWRGPDKYNDLILWERGRGIARVSVMGTRAHFKSFIWYAWPPEDCRLLSAAGYASSMREAKKRAMAARKRLLTRCQNPRWRVR